MVTFLRKLCQCSSKSALDLFSLKIIWFGLRFYFIHISVFGFEKIERVIELQRRREKVIIDHVPSVKRFHFTKKNHWGVFTL
jgi:myosin-crossreactive antigen